MDPFQPEKEVLTLGLKTTQNNGDFSTFPSDICNPSHYRQSCDIDQILRIHSASVAHYGSH